MDNVVVFPGAKPPPVLAPVEPSLEAVRLVEDLLERVKAGKVSAVAIVEVETSGATGTCWSNTDTHYLNLLAGAAQLVSRMTR